MTPTLYLVLCVLFLVSGFYLLGPVDSPTAAGVLCIVVAVTAAARAHGMRCDGIVRDD